MIVSRAYKKVNNLVDPYTVIANDS